MPQRQGYMNYTRFTSTDRIVKASKQLVNIERAVTAAALFRSLKMAVKASGRVDKFVSLIKPKNNSWKL